MNKEIEILKLILEINKLEERLLSLSHVIALEARRCSNSKFLDDYHFCTDRSLFSGVGYGTNLTEYGGYNRLYTNKNPQLTCPQANDKFSVHSGDGNASLTYPIALLTADEAYYAGAFIQTIKFIITTEYGNS